MSTVELKAYEIFKLYFKKEEDAQFIIDFIDKKADEKFAEKQIATKTDIKELELKIEQTKSDLIKWFMGLFITIALMVLGLYIRK